MERHARILVEGRDPAARIPLTYLDGTPVLDRRGRPRFYSAAADSFAGLGHRRARERELRRQAARAAEASRVAAETARVRSEARLGILPPPGKLASVDLDALIIAGPLGAVGLPVGVLRSLQVLAQGKRHPVAALISAGHWRDEAALAAALDAARPRLAATGLRICRRKGGWRLAAAVL
ncbi:hypothetical protein [Methylobacterium radiodurans]|uniref:Uncharacterized protein n=1 Tax=Methylobacterium radiodurans TaxID=2202828 RepID=A0A2U8VS24_9HYPH|nr:hypothetical protein [Methylobacterium radiodurans]AWN36534.1 hypothetical protein DK427_13000 [Methylobacterium radiodurans]